MISRLKALGGTVFTALVGALASVTHYGRPEDRKDAWWWAHWQNLSKVDGEGEFPFKGRVWFSRAKDDGRTSLCVSWAFPSKFAHAYVEVDRDEASVCVSTGVWPLTTWVRFESWPLLSEFVKRTGEREIGVHFDEGVLRWRLWTNPNEWLSTTPRWREGSFSVVDALLGAMSDPIEERAEPTRVTIPMPEGNYAATCTIVKVRRSRERWFSETFHRYDVKLDVPIPIPGKGENSYDCDDDHISAQSGSGRTPAFAVSQVVQSALSTRQKYGGRDWLPPGFVAGGDGRQVFVAQA